MISRFFKKKPKAPEPKKRAPERPRSSQEEPRRLLTAEGWKRLMMRKSSKGRK